MTELRPLLPSELVAAYDAIELAFGGDPHPEDRAVELAMIDPRRTLAAFDGGTPVATAGSFDLPMTIPGAIIPVAGVTWVSVSPVQRRRGLLSSMMRRQLDDLHSEGKAVAALWASEGGIYQRFGYGVASRQLHIAAPRGAAFSRPVDTDGLQLVAPTQARLAPLHQHVAAATPGWSARPDAWWSYRLYDPPHRRHGASPLRCVVDGDDGYALYTTKSGWGDSGPEGTVRLRELAARTPAAAARLWRYLLDLDLMTTVTASELPVDSPLLELLAAPRGANARLSDGLWMRLVDVAAALPLRRYAAEIDVVLQVADEHCPWNAGRYRLAAGPSGATCTTTTDPAQLSLTVRELGAAYLGGTSLQALARAGWVEELRPGALAAASTAFGWSGNAAHCPMVF